MAKSNFKLFQFDPIIYPRLLWVAVGDIKTLEEKFCYSTGSPIDLDINGIDGSTLSVINKTTHKFGTIIWIPSIKEATVKVITHEATHAALQILLDVGVKLDYENQEPIAYLIEWVCEKAFGILEKLKK